MRRCRGAGPSGDVVLLPTSPSRNDVNGATDTFFSSARSMAFDSDVS